MKREIKIGEETYQLRLTQLPEGQTIEVNQQAPAVMTAVKLSGNRYQFQMGGKTIEATAVSKGEQVFIEAMGRNFTTTVLDPVEQAHAASEAGDLSAKAPMPGVVVELHVEVEELVVADQALLTIESMKLLTVIRATGEGRVTAINFQAGDTFDKSAVLVNVQVIEKEGEHA